MAAVQRYVNTAADGTGDGTTNGTTGASGAYASLSSWDSSEATNLVTAGDTHTVDCCGSTADSTAVNIGTDWTTGAANTLTIQSNRSDAAGFYDGHGDVISTSHYRLDLGIDTTVLNSSSRGYITIDGLQFVHNGSNLRPCVNGVARGDGHFQNNRIFAATGLGFGFTDATTFNNQTNHIDNNIVCGFNQAGIKITFTSSFSSSFAVYNNTVFSCGTGLQATGSNTSSDATFKNNALYNNTADYDDTGVTGGTVTHDYNAGQDAPPTDETHGVTLSGTLTDDITDPQTDQTADVFPVTGGALDGAGIGNSSDSNVPTTDLLGSSRSTTAPSIGAFEAAASGSGGGGLTPGSLGLMGVGL